MEELSDVSADDEPVRCGSCEDADNLLGHLQGSLVCREATMKEKLPRQWWIERYLNDTDLLLLDLSIVMSCCLNVGGCSLGHGVIERNSRHPFNNPDCLRFYKLAPIFAQLNVNANNLDALKNFLRNRKRLISAAKAKEVQGFASMMESQMNMSCEICGLQGPVISGFELTRQERRGQRMICSKPLCEDLDNQVDFHPRTLAFERGTASRPLEGDHQDHLVALRAPLESGFVLCPAQMVNQDFRVPPDERIKGTERIVVLVPNTFQSMGRSQLEDPSKRAADDWVGLKQVADATLAPRTMLLDNFGKFIQAGSVLYRTRLADFRKCCWDKTYAMKNTAKGRIEERSPNKTDATFGRPNFRLVAPGAIEEKFPWSDLAEWARQSESEARSVINGKVKTKVRVRLLNETMKQWSPKLKSVMVRSFQREVIEATDGVKTVTCVGPCDPGFCAENHMQLDAFLEQELSGVNRLARIPLVLNYLKAKVECFRKTVLDPGCDQYDMKIEWDKDSWSVYMVGHLWTKGRKSLNEKAARKWYKENVDIVRRVVQRTKDMETVSLDPICLEKR